MARSKKIEREHVYCSPKLVVKEVMQLVCDAPNKCESETALRAIYRRLRVKTQDQALAKIKQLTAA